MDKDENGGRLGPLRQKLLPPQKKNVRWIRQWSAQCGCDPCMIPALRTVAKVGVDGLVGTVPNPDP